MNASTGYSYLNTQTRSLQTHRQGHTHMAAHFQPKSERLFAVRDKEGNIISHSFKSKTLARNERDKLGKEHKKDFFITIDKEHWENAGLSTYQVSE